MRGPSLRDDSGLFLYKTESGGDALDSRSTNSFVIDSVTAGKREKCRQNRRMINCMLFALCIA